MSLPLRDVAITLQRVNAPGRLIERVAYGNRLGHCEVVDVDAAVELYGLPRQQFTAARNRLATAIRQTGDIAGSAAIKGLRKPTVAAWLANHLVRVAPDQIAELTDFGDELRAVVLAGDGAQLRRLTPHRHEVVERLVSIAVSEASNMGRVDTSTVAERLGETSTRRWSTLV